MASRSNPHWIEIGDTPHAWERDALDYLRDHLPHYDPFRGFALFEFVADDGSINEVDALVIGRGRIYLVEIKSWPGSVSGDTRDWFNDRGDGRRPRVYENPLLAADRKCKRLASLLARQPATRKAHARLPFVQPLIFLSHPTIVNRLPGVAAQHVYRRDETVDGEPRPGIIGALAAEETRRPIDHPTLAAILRALDEAGIRPSRRRRTVGDYELGERIGEGPGFQDWAATHVSLDEPARVRIYATARDAPPEDRAGVERAARREYELIGRLRHPGIDSPRHYTITELGPALIYERVPEGQRLDAYLAARVDELDLPARVALVRQLAETIDYAHRHGIVHRALAPQSIEVVDPESARPLLRVRDWHAGFQIDASTGHTRAATSHPGLLLAEPTYMYLAPEALAVAADLDEAADVFSFGAVAYHILTGEPPAATPQELVERSRRGLSLSGVIDGVPDELELLIQYCTSGDRARRPASMTEAAHELASAEAALHRDEGVSDLIDPSVATLGDDVTAGVTVVERLGSGATSYALCVERDGVPYVLKVARDAEHDRRLQGEAAALKQLHHACIVPLHDVIDVQGRTGLLLDRAGEESLSEHLRAVGHLHPDMLERWGCDLLEALVYLESMGVAHRDIKPENIGIQERAGSRAKHLMLFDFSLANAPLDAVRAGTTGYVDPFLPERKAWDLHADRWSAAATLHQMATGELPRFGDGRSDPATLGVEATVDESAYDPVFADGLASFFRTALRRSVAERYPTGEEMLRAWRAAFEGAPAGIEEGESPSDPAVVAERASLDDPLVGLGVSGRVVALLGRLGAETVRSTLSLAVADVNRATGASHATKREASALVGALQERFADEQQVLAGVRDEALSIDLIADRLVPQGPDQAQQRFCAALVGLDEPTLEDQRERDAWTPFEEVAARLGLSDPTSALDTARGRWQRMKALTALRADVEAALAGEGGVMTVGELGSSLLARRGSSGDPARRQRLAAAVARACLEAEAGRKEQRFELHRHAGAPLVTLSATLESAPIDGLALALYAVELGETADRLATAEPSPTAGRAFDELRGVTPPDGFDLLPDSRLVRLGAAASQTAAVSGRLELYPRGMAAARAVERARGVLLTLRNPTVDDIQRRIASRFPEAESLPSRPTLDKLLADAKLPFRWDHAAGRYEIDMSTGDGVSIGSTRLARRSTTLSASPADPAALDAQRFERRLADARKRGGFLCLVTRPSLYEYALAELDHRFDLSVVSLDRMLIHHLRLAAAKRGVQWDRVLSADAARRESTDWARLGTLLDDAVVGVETDLLAQQGAVILLDVGLAARYDRLDLIDRLRDAAGGVTTPLEALWLLIPGDATSERPLVDGAAIPVLGQGQWAWIPTAWLENRHRGGGAPVGAIA